MAKREPETEAADAEPVPETPPTVGDRLRAAREKQGLTLEEVAAQTRIPQRHLASIETAEWDSLPAPTSSAPTAPAPAAPVKPSGPVVLTATAPAWIQVTDQGKTLFEGQLQPGQSYSVPASVTAPMLKAGKPEALNVNVGATTVPQIGPAGKVTTVSLLPSDLLKPSAAGPPAAAPPTAAPPPAAS